MKRLTVSPIQVAAQRAHIELRGGEDKVDPVIVPMAHAEKAGSAKSAGMAS
jgi:hypothetical protein